MRGLGTWEGTTLLQPNKDFFPTSASPLPLLHHSTSFFLPDSCTFLQYLPIPVSENILSHSSPPCSPNHQWIRGHRGGPPRHPPLPANAPPVEREKEGVGGKKDDEEENKKREKPRDGTQSETCGAESGTSDQQQQPTQFSVKETSYSEGNVKLKIGLQAKRMKKPPKILENYICRPAFRATVRHSGGRGGGRVNRGARANDGSNHTSSPSCGKESEKSPSVSRGAPLSSSAPAAASSSPSLPPPVCTSSVTPVSGSAPAKRVRLFNFSPCIS